MESPFGKSFSLEVLTPTSCTCRMDVVSVVFPAVDGQVGVMTGRAPLVAVVGCGRLIVEPVSGKGREFFVAGGFAHVHENAMAVLAEECIPLEDMDAEAIWEELEQARHMPVETDEHWTQRDKAIDVARLKFSLAQRQRRKAMRE